MDVTESSPDPVDPIMEACFERPQAEWDQAIQEACQRHPDHAAAIRQRYESLKVLRAVRAELASDDEDIPEVLGDFRLLGRLGGGGMGLVFRAVQTSLGREVALKLIRPEQLFLANARKRFRREVETIAQLQHPGIISIYTVGEERGIPFFAMELLAGETLAEIIDRLQSRAPESLTAADLQPESVPSGEARSAGGLFQGPWIEACLALIRQVAEALEHAHERGVLHRDVKPSNIMLVPDGRAILLDFGLTSTVEPDSTSRITRSGTTLGTVAYMSPEQLSRSAALDGRSDLYSLGVTLYELLTLQLPFTGDDMIEVHRQILAGGADPIRARNRQVVEDVETVCLTAMARRLDDRYAKAADLAADLANAIERRPILARPPGRLLRVVRWTQRNRPATVAILSALLLVIGLPLTFLGLEIRHSRELQSQRDELLRLSAAQEVEDLQLEARRLWPPHPRHVPALRSWLGRAEFLAEQLDDLRDIQQQVDGRASPGAGFPREEDRWLSNQLSRLIAEIEEIVDPDSGLIRGISTANGWGIEQRLEHSLIIEERSTRAHEELWDEAVTEIFLAEAYAELELEPQIGLVPLGPDPDTGLWEFWHVLSGLRPERDRETEQLVLTPAAGMVFVLLPGGTFWMGSQFGDPAGPNYDPQARPDERPHQVTLAPFFLSKYEMTIGQWKRAMFEDPCIFEPAPDGTGLGRDHPVTSISQEQCHEALRRYGLDLPTEAQWEYGCRAGTHTAWWCGQEKETIGTLAAGNLCDETASRNIYPLTWGQVEPWEDGATGTAPVGSYLANPFGLHDVIGNVYEVSRDLYGPYDAPTREGDGLRLFENEDGSFVIRGGGFQFPSSHARSAMRDVWAPGMKSGDAGLRPAAVIQQNGGE